MFSSIQATKHCTVYSPQTKCPSKKKRQLHSVQYLNLDVAPTMHDKYWTGKRLQKEKSVSVLEVYKGPTHTVQIQLQTFPKFMTLDVRFWSEQIYLKKEGRTCFPHPFPWQKVSQPFSSPQCLTSKDKQHYNCTKLLLD